MILRKRDVTSLLWEIHLDLDRLLISLLSNVSKIDNRVSTCQFS